MKACFSLLLSFIACLVTNANNPVYVGSTPAHPVIRHFLQISLTDSIDFIRWKLEIGSGTFTIQCAYGLSQPGTPGFSNEQEISFEGRQVKAKNYYEFSHQGRNLSIVEVNANVLHFVDQHHQMLVGNGGYSFALNNRHPVEVKELNIRPVQEDTKTLLVYEGRTPCNRLPALLGLSKSDACNKMKWYFLLYADSLTGKPLYFLMGGMGYRKETMAKGSWQIVTDPEGRIIYRLASDKWTGPLRLLKGDENILFFIDSKGGLLVGNEDFSYTLNRRKEAYPPVNR